MKKTYRVINSIRYNFEDKKLVSFTYYFGDGEQTHVDNTMLSESEMAEIEEMARLEYNCEQREYRRKLKAKEVGICNNNSNTDPVLTEIVRREQNKATANAFNELLPEQQELIRLIHLQDVKAREIAKRDNVSDSAISKRLQRAENNLKKLLA